MGTSELLRTPLTVFLVVVTLVLAFLAAHRIRSKWLRIPVRVTCSIGAVLVGLLLALMLFARGKPTETISETKNGSFKVLVRSQEFRARVSNPPSQAAEPVVKCGYGSSDERSHGKTTDTGRDSADCVGVCN